jgi:hypothetical protein
MIVRLGNRRGGDVCDGNENVSSWLYNDVHVHVRSIQRDSACAKE